jgi:hypothetical protein
MTLDVMQLEEMASHFHIITFSKREGTFINKIHHFIYEFLSFEISIRTYRFHVLLDGNVKVYKRRYDRRVLSSKERHQRQTF